AAAEVEELLLGQVLVAKHQHLVLVQRVAIAPEFGVGERTRQVAADHLGAHHGIHRTDDDRGFVCCNFWCCFKHVPGTPATVDAPKCPRAWLSGQESTASCSCFFLISRVTKAGSNSMV